MMRNKPSTWTLFFVVFTIFSSCEKKKDAVHPTRVCSYATDMETVNHPKKTTFQAVLDKYTDQGLPGISLLIKDSSGRWVGSSGYADIRRETPFIPCHISKVASITKFMMGALTMKLQEEGKLNIHEKISEYIPAEVTAKVKHADKVTIRQCMNHTTGIYDIITDSEFYLAVLNNPNKKWTGMELIQYVYDKAPENEIGVADYSNTNTLLLSMVIEGATGKPHAALLKTKVIEALGMNDTYYHHHDELPASTAQGYYDLYNTGKVTNISNYITGNGNGYNGIYSNVYDLHTFLDEVLIKQDFISPGSLDTMLTFTPVHDDETAFYGPGIMKRFADRGVNYGLGHTGRDLGYSADLFYFPNKEVSLVFLVNYGTDAESSLKPVFDDFEREIIDAALQ